jgi:glutathione S-transferase
VPKREVGAEAHLPEDLQGDSVHDNHFTFKHKRPSLGVHGIVFRMTLRFVDLETAKASTGLRLVLLTNAPSPWSDSVLALVAAKQLDAVAVRLTAGDVETTRWSGVPNAPAALFADELPRSGWAEILSLLERLAPGHVPVGHRIELFGLGHELLGERGLAWARRAMLVARGQATDGREGLSPRAGQFLSPRYGHVPDEVEWARDRCISILKELDARLASKPFYFEQLSALDVYSAACINALLPLPDSIRALPARARAAFGWLDEAVAAAITPRLLDHRDRQAHLFKLAEA